MKRWIAGVLYAMSMSATAEVSHCPQSSSDPRGDVIPQRTFIAFPQDHLFQPLIADPKEHRFFSSYRYYDRPEGMVHIGVIGFGETFPLFRLTGECANDGLQLDIAGGSVARFQLDDAINDLIDADYNVSFPLTWRRRNWSLRTQLYHESSHLGENKQFRLIASEREKRSYSGIDAIVSYDWEKWRIYYGAEHLFHHYPKIDKLGLHLGIEYQEPHNLFRKKAFWSTGLDVKAWEEYGFSPDFSFKTGLSFGNENASQHHMQLMLEWYDGHANEGVFYDDKVR